MKSAKAEAERRVEQELLLTRDDFSNLTYEFVKSALKDGKRIVVENDRRSNGVSIFNGTSDGYEIRMRSEADDVVGTAKFSELKKAANSISDYFSQVAAKPNKNAVCITYRGSSTGLVLAKTNDLDTKRRQP